MDFKERGMIQMVKTGDLLAVKTPAKPGVDGVDVFGEPIPAENGQESSSTASAAATSASISGFLLRSPLTHLPG